MTWTFHSLPRGDLDEWSEAWDRLNRDLYADHPLFDSRFMSALIRNFGNGHECLAVHGPIEAPDGMLVLRRRRNVLYETFRPAQAQVCPVLVRYPETLHSLFRDLGVGVVMIDYLCQDPLYTPIGVGECSEVPEHSVFHALTMNVSMAESFDEFWSGRPRQLRYNLRKYHKKLERDNVSVAFHHIRDIESFRGAVARYAHIEQTGWKGKAGTAVSVDEAQGQFYIELLERFGASGQAEVYELYFDGKLVASMLLIRNADMVVFLKTTFDERYAKTAPGRILLYRALKREFRLGLSRCCEFYTNAHGSSAQLGWATGTREICHVTLYRSRAVGRVHGLFKNLKAVLTESGRS